MKKLTQFVSTHATTQLYAAVALAVLMSLTISAAAQAWPAGKLTSKPTFGHTEIFEGCGYLGTWYTWTYTDTSSVQHTFGTNHSAIWTPQDPGCGSQYTTGFEAYSSDGKGYLILTGGSTGNIIGITATLFPSYQILSLLYDAPGNQSSNGFTNTTFYGSTSSIGSTFTSGITFTFTASGGIFGLGGGTSSSIGFTQGFGTTNSFTNTISSGQGLSLLSTHNAVDHTNDTFWIWLNPEVAITQTGSTTASYSVGPPSGQVMDAVRVSVAQLQNPSTIPLSILEPIVINGVTYPGLDSLCAHPLPPAQCTQANACGCVPSDFNQPGGILSVDPIISITGNTPPSNIDAKRYFSLNPQPSPQPFLEYGTPDTITFSDSSQQSKTQTETNGYTASYSTTFGSSVHSFPVDWTFQETITSSFSWTQTVSLNNFSGTSHSMNLTLATSTPNCAEPIDVYEDYNYHTFVAVPASTPPPACDSN